MCLPLLSVFLSAFLSTPRLNNRQIRNLQPPDTMDHAQAVLAGTEEATVEDFIEWQEEMSRRTGEIGFSMGSWDSDEVCDVWNNLIENENASETQIHDVSEPQWETSLDEFLKQNHQEDFQWLQRMKMMQANKSLFSKTVLEVHRRLLQEGKTQQDIEHYITTKTPLRHQIMHLRQLEHPTPQKPVGGVDVWLVLGPKPEHREIISLPVKASLNEVSKLLEGFKKSAMMFLEDSSTTQPADQEQPTWQYRIVTGPPWTPASKRVKLRDDADYQKMVRGLISKRSVKIMALIEEVM